jgi:hypothetical protein
MAKGWSREDIVVCPVSGGYDPMVPDDAGNTTLSPLTLWPLFLQLDVRRSLAAGEHWGLFPNTSLAGMTSTEALKRDKRRAAQAAFIVFVRQMNEARNRGFVVHGSWIPNCPNPNRLLLMAPWWLGSALDAVAAWVFGNSFHFYCYVCLADKDRSREYPGADDLLEPRLVEPVAGLRRDANAPAVTQAEVAARRAVVSQLEDEYHVHPELTAHDELAAVNSGGKRNLMVDQLHVSDGLVKHGIKGVKEACSDPASVEGTGRAIKTVARIINDHVACAEHFNNGYHTLPGVYNFLGMQTLTAMTVRSCAFSLLATFCSVSDLFTPERQTAIIQMLTALIHLVRNSNLRVWDASVPDRLDGIVEVLGEVWPPAVGKWVNFERPILHLMAHWRQQYTALGTPVQWTTKDFIEAMQRVLRAAYLRTNLNDVQPQIMGQLSLLKYVDTVIEPSLRERSGEHGDSDEDDDGPPRVAALQSDRATQAYLRGATVKAVPGFNTVFGDPADHAEDSWNAGMRKALRACAQVLDHPRLPLNHICQGTRIYPRNSCFLCRRGICARSVPAYPEQCVRAVADTSSEHAIFSVYESVAVAGGGAAGGAAAAAAAAPSVVESQSKYFVVDGWFSYDVRGLSSADPNAPPPPKRLTTKELGGDDCIDLCFGRWLTVLPSVTGSGIAGRDVADTVLRRVKPEGAGKLTILEVGALCQPLWVFPWLRNYDAALEAFSRGSFTKWDAEQWLVATWLY